MIDMIDVSQCHSHLHYVDHMSVFVDDLSMIDNAKVNVTASYVDGVDDVDLLRLYSAMWRSKDHIYV